MTHTNQNAVALMWAGDTINFNVKKGVKLEVNDLVFIGSTNNTNVKIYYQINEILETKQSSLEDYNYIKTNSTRIIQ